MGSRGAAPEENLSKPSPLALSPRILRPSPQRHPSPQRPVSPRLSPLASRASPSRKATARPMELETPEGQTKYCLRIIAGHRCGMALAPALMAAHARSKLRRPIRTATMTFKPKASTSTPAARKTRKTANMNSSLGVFLLPCKHSRRKNGMVHTPHIILKHKKTTWGHTLEIHAHLVCLTNSRELLATVRHARHDNDHACSVRAANLTQQLSQYV